MQFELQEKKKKKMHMSDDLKTHFLFLWCMWRLLVRIWGTLLKDLYCVSVIKLTGKSLIISRPLFISKFKAIRDDILKGYQENSVVYGKKCIWHLLLLFIIIISFQVFISCLSYHHILGGIQFSFCRQN